MRKAIKSKGKIAKAYELGTLSEEERKLIVSDKIRKLNDGSYEIFSREAVNGSGEIAYTQDYFKIDQDGFPYPIKRDYFLAHHKKIDNDLYEQTALPLDAWTEDDGMCSEIAFLIEHKGLVIDEKSFDKYFSASLFGTYESAARDCVIVFYKLIRDTEGNIIDAEFNFVDREIFNMTYEWVESD